MDKIELKGEIIRLGQLLKLAGLVDTGGEAKALIQAGEVRVNGQVETRRGRQLQEGDRVAVADREVEVTYLS
jgi:ribosome-associated protein